MKKISIWLIPLEPFILLINMSLNSISDIFFNLITNVDPLLFELGVILVLAAILGVILKALKQPLILAYLITGIIIGFFGFLDVGGRDALELFSNLGVMFLLFLVGLEIDYRSIKQLGKTSIILGLTQILASATGGFLIANFIFNFNPVSSLYIAIALAFSSTVIIIKLLSQKKEINSLYGRISVGLLLIQDLVVILILIGLNAIEVGGEFRPEIIIRIIMGAVFLFGLMISLGRFVFPYLFKKIAHSQELLFLVSLAWLLFFSVFAKMVGFSIEIAGFLSGIALANSSHKYHIASKVRPLRDFFILIFFVIIGSLVVVSNFNEIIIPILVLSLFVMVTKPLIVMLILKHLGYTKRTGFLTASTVPQISEFSLIFATLGLSIGHINEQTFALITTIGIITFVLSTYSILYSEKIYPKINKHLNFFEKENTIEERESDMNISKPIILIGANRTGKGMMNYLNKNDLLVVDFDPLVIKNLKEKNIKHLFSDITDPDILDELNLEETKVIISTSPNFKDNRELVKKIKKIKNNIKLIIRAEEKEDALHLYQEGVDYVLLPHFVSGQYLGSLIDPEFNLSRLDELREIDLKLLKNNHA